MDKCKEYAQRLQSLSEYRRFQALRDRRHVKHEYTKKQCVAKDRYFSRSSLQEDVTVASRASDKHK